MVPVLIKDLLTSAPDQRAVTVCGWVRTVRDSKNLVFVQVNDGSCFANIQLTFDRSNPSANADASNIEESLKNQNMLDEVMGAVQDLFFEICGEKAFCTEEQKDPDTGSFSLTYQIQDCPAPVVFECSHLGTFDLYFRYVDKAQTEKEHDSIFSKYDHKMDKDHIREALRLLLSVKH